MSDNKVIIQTDSSVLEKWIERHEQRIKAFKNEIAAEKAKQTEYRNELIRRQFKPSLSETREDNE